MSELCSEEYKIYKFFRDKEKLVVGDKPEIHHHDLIESIRGRKMTNVDVWQELRSDPQGKDMGRLMRVGREIQVDGKSETYDFPTGDRLREERIKTLESFRSNYPEYEFYEGES